MSAQQPIPKYGFYEEISITEDMGKMLTAAETPIFAAKTVRDYAIFTDKRILVVDKQGIMGKKVEYFTIPYKSIVAYAIETAGTFDLDSEIKLHLSGGLEIELDFFKKRGMESLLFKAYETITKFIL